MQAAVLMRNSGLGQVVAQRPFPALLMLLRRRKWGSWLPAQKCPKFPGSLAQR